MGISGVGQAPPHGRKGVSGRGGRGGGGDGGLGGEGREAEPVALGDLVVRDGGEAVTVGDECATFLDLVDEEAAGGAGPADEELEPERPHQREDGL
jgi:hypothetical protein